jgi:vancomycin resistance protein VanW
MLASDCSWPFSYHVEERKHRFLQKEDGVYRENELWRQVIDKTTGQKCADEKIMHNLSLVAYPVAAERLENG